MQRYLSGALIVVSFMLIICSWRLIKKDRESKKPPVIKTITNCHDTLYIIEETRTEKRSYGTQDFNSITMEESQPDVLFKDGKTCDTIRRKTIEYY